VLKILKLKAIAARKLFYRSIPIDKAARMECHNARQGIGVYLTRLFYEKNQPAEIATFLYRFLLI
jgi:hypothetical protein